jgi:outer membrane protein assembly factor BamB
MHGAASILAVAGLAVAACGDAGPSNSASRGLSQPANRLEAETGAQLEALGYSAWEEIPEPDRGKAGVTTWDRSRTQPGFNLWNSLPRQEAVLSDLSGRTVHRWQRPTGGEWGHIELLVNGDLLILHERPNQLIRLDWNSRLIWRRRISVSHDADVSSEGEIYVINTKRARVADRSGQVPILDDYLAILAPDGSLLRELSFARLLRDHFDLSAERQRVQGAAEETGFLDPLHVNTLSIVREDRGEIFKKGRVLFAARNLNLIGVLDLEREEVVWTAGRRQLDRPHQPVLLRSGNLLVFDNGAHRGFSRLVEFDPQRRAIVWQYRASPPTRFFSKTMGGNQALDNGNILVTESSRGRVFEITREGEIVWEFFNPDIDPDAKKRAAIYRMRRIGPESLAPELWQELSRRAAASD